MSVTLTELVTAVNAELENKTERGSATATGDGSATAFLVAPHGYSVVNDATFAVYADGVLTTAYTMDYDSGVITFTSAPADAVVLTFTFNYCVWTDAMVETAINAGIHSLFPKFYVPAKEIQTADGTSYEYTLRTGPSNSEKTITGISKANPTVITCVGHGFASGTEVTFSGSDSVPSIDGDYVITSTGTDSFTIPVNVSTTAGTTGTAKRPTTVEFLTRVFSRADADSPWSPIKRSKYDAYHDEGDYVVNFFSAPNSGQLKFHTINRPQPLQVAAETLESTAGLPARAKLPIVSYACYYLLTQKTAPRARGDVAIATQGVGTLSPRQMNDVSNAFYLRYQMQLESVKQPPWSTL